jgi:hypothetical protein
MTFHCGKLDSNSLFSSEWFVSSLLTPSNQMSSFGEELISPKILPSSQDLEVLRLKREEKERRILFFFLNILGRNNVAWQTTVAVSLVLNHNLVTMLDV